MKNTANGKDNLTNQQTTYVTLEKNGSATIIEKKSEFIGYACHVKTEQEAIDFVNSIRKKHADATHNVYAYVISENNYMRYSDDGEPSGTAGMPVLDVIRKSGFTDAAIVVTRYFGGTLLGKGGLVRAYTSAAKAAVDEAKIVTYVKYAVCEIECSYNEYEKIKNEFKFYPVIEDDTLFTDCVKIKCAIKEEFAAEFDKKLSEMTAGNVKLCILGERFDV